MDLHRFSAFDYMKLVVGSALLAAAFQYFTFPNSIVSGGVTGIAQIIRLLTGIPVGVLSILINIPIFYLGWRHRLGTRRLVLALCVMALISVLIDALALTGLVVTDEPMLGAVYGGVLNGAGYGLIYTTGTTGGGTDIVARLAGMLGLPHVPARPALTPLFLAGADLDRSPGQGRSREPALRTRSRSLRSLRHEDPHQAAGPGTRRRLVPAGRHDLHHRRCGGTRSEAHLSCRRR